MTSDPRSPTSNLRCCDLKSEFETPDKDGGCCAFDGGCVGMEFLVDGQGRDSWWSPEHTTNLHGCTSRSGAGRAGGAKEITQL